jgi:hypothetical protein
MEGFIKEQTAYSITVSSTLLGRLGILYGKRYLIRQQILGSTGKEAGSPKPHHGAGIASSLLQAQVPAILGIYKSKPAHPRVEKIHPVPPQNKTHVSITGGIGNGRTAV